MSPRDATRQGAVGQPCHVSRDTADRRKRLGPSRLHSYTSQSFRLFHIEFICSKLLIFFCSCIQGANAYGRLSHSVLPTPGMDTARLSGVNPTASCQPFTAVRCCPGWYSWCVCRCGSSEMSCWGGWLPEGSVCGTAVRWSVLLGSDSGHCSDESESERPGGPLKQRGVVKRPVTVGPPQFGVCNQARRTAKHAT